jgi:hypothetical protein
VDLRVGWEAVEVARQVRAVRARRRVLLPFQGVSAETRLAEHKPSV